MAVGLLTVGLMTACSSSDSDSGGPASADSSSVLGAPKAATGTPVSVGFISEGKGAAIDNTNEIQTAKAAAAYVNEYLGGIGGHPITLEVCETRADTATAISCANQLVEKKVVAVLAGALADDASSHKVVTQAGIPFVIASGGSAEVLDSTDLTYAFMASPVTTLAAPAAYAKANDIKSVGAVIIQVPTVTGQWEDLGKPLYTAAGLDLVTTPIAPGTPDMTPQIQSLIRDDPEMVQVIGNASFCLSAFQGLQTLGYSGKISSIPQCVDETVVDTLGDSLDGQLVTSMTSLDPDEASYQLYKTVADKYQPGTDLGGSASTGFVSVLGFARALESGGLAGDVTTESVNTAMKASKDVDLPLGAGIKFTCSARPIAVLPAVCSPQTLVGTLTAEGVVTDPEIVDSQPLFAAIG